METKIEVALRLHNNILKNQTSKSFYLPYLDGIIENPLNGEKSTVQRFLIDTGASISVLGRVFHRLFDEKTPINEYAIVKYGDGKTREFPVYKVNLKVQGVLFKDLIVAFDKQMETHLLGNLGFINELEHLGISKKRKKISLIF